MVEDFHPDWEPGDEDNHRKVPHYEIIIFIPIQELAALVASRVVVGATDYDVITLVAMNKVITACRCLCGPDQAHSFHQPGSGAGVLIIQKHFAMVSDQNVFFSTA